MNKLCELNLIVLAGLCVATGPAYGSMTLNFSYEFGSGLKLTGTLDGDPNGNLVENLSNISVLFDGTAMTIYPGPFSATLALGAVYTGGWNSTDGFNPSQAPVVSFDGTENNFLFISSDFPKDWSGSYFDMITDSGFYFADTYGQIPDVGGVVSSDTTADFSRWSLTPAAVPEPSTCVAGAMLLLPFGASALRLLRKKQAA